jgi:hypothetical protein
MWRVCVLTCTARLAAAVWLSLTESRAMHGAHVILAACLFCRLAPAVIHSLLLMLSVQRCSIGACPVQLMAHTLCRGLDLALSSCYNRCTLRAPHLLHADRAHVSDQWVTEHKGGRESHRMSPYSNVP